MKLLTETEMQIWCSERGVSCQNGVIRIACSGVDWRFWTLPSQPAGSIRLLEVIFDAIDPWDHLLLCKLGLSPWYAASSETDLRDVVHDRIISSTGLPSGCQSAILAGRADLTDVTTLLFAQLLFGWCQTDDVFVVPDHAQQIISASHHDVIQVDFRDPARVNSFVKVMEAEEFPLPDAPPDATFKIPKWMRKDKA